MTKIMTFVRAMGSLTPAPTEPEPNKVFRCSGSKLSGPADDEEVKLMIALLTLSSVTVL